MSKVTTKRQGMISLVLLIAHYFISGAAIAEDNADAGVSIAFRGELIKTTCDIRFDKDLLFIEPIRVTDLSGPDSVSEFSKPFTLYIENCLISPIAISNIQLTFDASVSYGKIAPGAFTNQATDSAGLPLDNGVGFAVYDRRDNENVLTLTGLSRVINYRVDSHHPLNEPHEFYVKYIQTSATVTPGPVETILTVSAFYE